MKKTLTNTVDELAESLKIINDWLEEGLIKWNNNLQAVIEDWDKCNEHPQPKKEIKRFEKITGFKYTGP